MLSIPLRSIGFSFARLLCLSSVALTTHVMHGQLPLDDYIPCALTPQQQMDLKFPGVSSVEIGEKKATSVSNLVNESGLPPEVKKALQSDLATHAEQLPNLSPKDALKTFTGWLDSAYTSTKIKTDMARASLLGSVTQLLTPVTSPNDVLCTVSFTSWKSARDVFGKRVADRYLALKVRVSNFNKANQYVLHDILVAVDNGPEQNSFEGVPDKEFVRDVEQRGQTEDARNVIVNILTGIGTIAAATSLSAGTTQFASGVSVYQAAFLPAINLIAPDHTLEQSNHINDFGFSASSANKIIVPVEGASAIVAFVEVTPLEQMRYVWCGNPKVESTPGFCDPTSPSTADSAAVSPQIKRNKFRNWKPAALEALKRNIYVIVGGVHIQEVSSGAATISSVDCPLINNFVDLTNHITNGQLSCPIVGTKLDTITNVALALEAGTNKASGSVTDSTNGTSAAIAFSISDLSALSGSYKLYIVDSTGKETYSGQSLAFATRVPSVTVISAQLNSKDTASTQEIKLTGKNLDQIKTALLVDKSDATIAAKPSPGTPVTSASTTAIYDIDTTALSKLAGQSLSLRITTADTNIDYPKLTLQVSPVAPPAKPR